ncbi:MAG TPA: PhnD/SsuA/transferrin family substrate-binding protein [Polyangiaceae bacterium]|jgi:phosphonate transport system substrate-binding protein
MGSLRLGLIPRGGDDDAREREFVAALGVALSCEVDVHRAANYRVVLTGLEQRLVDFAWLPPLVGARAMRARLADPVAVAVRYGDTTYTSALVTLPGSPIRSIADLRSVRVAWVDRESASGYAVLRGELARAGVRLADAFSRELFVRSHAAVARAVLDGEVDVGATCAHAEAGVVRFARSPYTGDAGLTSDELRVVFETGPIPSDLFAVRRGTAPGVRSLLEGAFLHARPPRVLAAACALMHADGFAVPTPEYHRMLERLIEP